MKKHLTTLLLLSLGATLAAACTSPSDGGRTEPILEGNFGDAGEFAGQPDLNEAYFYGDTTYLDVRTRGTGWAVMAALTLDGRLGEGDLASGSVVHVTAPDDWGWEDSPAITMLGCSGPVDDEWWTDCTPDDIVVQIEEGSQDGSVMMSFDATFPPDCGDGGIVGPPPEPWEPGDPGEPGGPGDPGEPTDPAEPPPPDGPPGAEPGAPPAEPLPPRSGTDAPIVISGVLEIDLADILDNGDGWGEPEPFLLDEGY